MRQLMHAPHSTESECFVLGTLLATSGRAYDRIADKLRDSDFHHEQHALIFNAVEQLVRAGKAADTLSVVAWLETQKALHKASGREYLSELAAGAPPASNISRYAEIIVERRMARQLIQAAQDMQEIAFEGGDIHERMTRAQGLLMAVGEANQSAEPTHIGQILADTIGWVQERSEAGTDITGLRTHLADLDKQTAGLQPGDLIILAGRPSMGKSALAQTISENVAEDGGGVLVFNLEMSLRQSGLRSIAGRGSVDLSKLMNPASITDQDDWSRMCEAVDRLANKNLYIDDTSAITVAQMHAKARRHKRKHGLSLIVVDYLQLMAGGGDDANRAAIIGAISRGLKLMAKDLGVPVIALSQLSRNCEQRQNKRPLMSDLRESGSLEQDADAVWLLYRDDYYHPNSQFKDVTEINIAKQRMGPTGRIGTIFAKQYSNFRNYSGPLPDPEGKPETAAAGGGAFSMRGA